MRSAPSEDPALAARPDDVIIALYTSGTTGTLKAAQHTQASYAAIVANILANLVSPTRDDVMLHAAPLIHASGTFVLPFWLRGGQAAVLDGFDPKGYLAAIPEYGIDPRQPRADHAPDAHGLGRGVRATSAPCAR